MYLTFRCHAKERKPLVLDPFFCNDGTDLDTSRIGRIIDRKLIVDNLVYSLMVMTGYRNNLDLGLLQI